MAPLSEPSARLNRYALGLPDRCIAEVIPPQRTVEMTMFVQR